MYGYVIVNKPELKFREFDVYRSYYCGLCDELKKHYGFPGQISISYDMTFLVMLLTGLYEPKTSCYEGKCIEHPIKKHTFRRNKVSQYVADMNILMTYYKCMDDWQDEKKLTRLTIAGSLKKKAKAVMKKYPQKAAVIAKELRAISEAEKNKEQNIDRVSAHFGEVMAQMAVMKNDEWSGALHNLGFCLGKFVYIIDAYEDMEDDIKHGNYNVLLYHKDNENFDGLCESILNAVMAQCARSFELLPIVQDVEILRNIIYSGVWTRFEMVKAKRKKAGEKTSE